MGHRCSVSCSVNNVILGVISMASYNYVFNEKLPCVKYAETLEEWFRGMSDEGVVKDNTLTSDSTFNSRSLLRNTSRINEDRIRGRVKSLNILSHIAGTNNKKTIDGNSYKRGVKIVNNSYNRTCANLHKLLQQQMVIPGPSTDNVKITHHNETAIALNSSPRHATSEAEMFNSDITVGSLVEVIGDSPNVYYGVVRWIGGADDDEIFAGVELEEEQPELGDGEYSGERYFSCPQGRALFVPLTFCRKDGRFQDVSVTSQPDTSVVDFGQMDCPVVPGRIPPLNYTTDLEGLCGKFRGIQGHHNSCYLDATLFSMFTFTSVFDSLLFRPPDSKDSVHYEEVQKVLREEIVNPLRQNLYVRADRVMKLRKLLEKLSSISGLTSEEKDPEEFLNSLVAQILRAEPFLKLSSGQEAYHYQLFVEKDENLSFPSVQQLFEQSFITSNIKLKEVPSCLIIQMPRFGKSYKMYPRILPSQLLDVTDVIDDAPRQCAVCGKWASFECRECFNQRSGGLEDTAYCMLCDRISHSHAERANHKSTKLPINPDYISMAEHCPVPRLYMELFAVVCIETSHYVAFVKAGSGHEAPWCFFDSMADRKGEQNGYNIPEIVLVDDIPTWLSEDGVKSLHEAAPHDKMLPEHAKRLFCDAYMCMYQSPDVSMYR